MKKKRKRNSEAVQPGRAEGSPWQNDSGSAGALKEQISKMQAKDVDAEETAEEEEEAEEVEEAKEEYEDDPQE